MIKIIIIDYSGHPFLFELSQKLSKQYCVIHSYAQYFETPKANFASKKANSNLKIILSSLFSSFSSTLSTTVCSKLKFSQPIFK